MMDYIDFLVYHREKRLMSQQAIDQLWRQMINDTSLRQDMKGKGSRGEARQARGGAHRRHFRRPRELEF